MVSSVIAMSLAARTSRCAESFVSFLPRYVPCWEATCAVCDEQLDQMLVPSQWLTAGRVVILLLISCNRRANSFISRLSLPLLSYRWKRSRTFSMCFCAMGTRFLICAAGDNAVRPLFTQKMTNALTHNFPFVHINTPITVPVCLVDKREQMLEEVSLQLSRKARSDRNKSDGFIAYAACVSNSVNRSQRSALYSQMRIHLDSLQVELVRK